MPTNQDDHRNLSVKTVKITGWINSRVKNFTTYLVRLPSLGHQAESNEQAF